VSQSEGSPVITELEASRFGERTLPALTDANRAFWTSGASGKWQFPRCTTCRRFIHPGQPRCTTCLTDTLVPEPVLGRGTVFTFTINRYAWLPGWETPYVAAIVELDDQPGLRVTSNLVGCDPEQVRIGDRVQVVFSPQGEYWVPLFRVVKSAYLVNVFTDV